MTRAPGTRSTRLIAIGVIVMASGVLFMFQGLGTVKSSSPMTGSNFWAVAGPVIAIAGLLLTIRGARRQPPNS
jgi:hypothetical protein